MSEGIREALDRALSLIGELMSYDNFEAYPPNMTERVKEFMAPFDEKGIAALSSPHPEAREEDIEIALGALEEIATTMPSRVCLNMNATTSDPDHVKLRNNHMAIAAQALSRLAAPKPEGQDWRETRFVLPKERGKYLCLFAGRKQEVLYWDNEDWYDTAGIRSPKYWMPLPAAPEPRPAEEEAK